MYKPNRSIQLIWFFSFGLMVLLSNCKKGEKVDNEPPETYTAVEQINLSGENRLNSLVTLRWWGTDPDGVVKGFEFSFDEETWYFTENQDSTFLFSINAGSDTVDIDFWVRAVDLEDATDPTPAYLSVPLKNTPPEIAFNKELIPSDSAFNLITLIWEASDLDGDQTIEALELKINEGEWVSFNAGRQIASIVPSDPSAGSTTSAQLIYDDATEGPIIEGLSLNALNSFYVRAVDIAGSYSNVDTIAEVFIRGKINDVLLLGANSAQPNAFYQSNLAAAGVSFDFIDLIRDDAVNQPPIWTPTFELLLEQYRTVVMYANDITFLNKQTNADDILLEYASTGIQKYIDNGGKLFLTTSFPNAFSTGSALFGILPIDSLSTSVGQARLPIDSLAEATENGYPDLLCNTFISGLDPIYPSSDATVIYTAQITKNNDWEGPNNIGVRRQLNGNTNFVFFSVELHKINGDPTAIEALFQKVMNDEFDW